MKGLFRTVFRLRERLLMRFRYAMLRTCLDRLGANVKLFGNPVIDCPEKIRIGDGCTINHGVVLGGRGGLTIGDNVRISPYAVIETGYLEPGGSPRVHGAKPIVIEDNVWIASGASVLAGVRVGRDSIIAAGAVVTRDVPAGSLAKGVPARFSRLAGT